ncbi:MULTISPECIES: hypothetical protein [unclassified Providencia]|uniref:hypothetical protein n=1 Tax=unclassified Providencia TaxID=2633465 RepID=UPI00234BA881|nr:MULTISPECIES: hypothetical protein [unclassified Providencia]
MKGYIVASLLMIACSGFYAHSSNGIDPLVADGKRSNYGDWDFFYAEKMNYDLCKLSVEAIYTSGAIDHKLTSITHFENAHTLITQTPKHVVRIDCNGHGGNIMILTADYIVQ